jgi:hypothetical protein
VSFATFLLLGEQCDVWSDGRAIIRAEDHKLFGIPEVVRNQIPGDRKHPSFHF